MKKIILAVLFSAITIIGFSQTTSYAYKLETGVWNTYTKKWMWQDLIDIDLTFTLGKTYIKIDDKANTFLSIIEQHRKQYFSSQCCRTSSKRAFEFNLNQSQ